MARKTIDDPELKAMATCAELLAPFGHDAQARVLGYLTDRFPDKPAARAYTRTELDRGIDSDDLAARDGRPAGVEP